MSELTTKQREVLDFLVSFQEENGRTPSGPEIADGFGYSDHSTVYQHLRAIARKGYLEITQSAHRRPLGIVLTEKAQRLFARGWPLLGTIPAGPISSVLGEDAEFVEGVEDLLPMLRQGDYFLTVEGDSMIGAGLEEGMTVLMRPDSVVKPGAICAVWIDGEGGTLKRVIPEGEMVRLVPENRRYSERRYSADQVRIQGVLVAAMAVRVYG